MLKIQIKGSDWSFAFLPNAQYSKRFGVDSSAITLLDSRKVFFNKSLIKPGTVRHELLHVLIAECNIESAFLAPAQIEELCASIICDQWNNINIWTETILNGLTQQPEVVNGANTTRVSRG
jgi:hypothetical protein